MTKFAVVTQEPKTLNKGEIVIKPATFLKEIAANRTKAPKSNLTAVNHLRGIVDLIGATYDPELNVFKIPFNQYEGRVYNSDEELSAIVCNILRQHYPQVFAKALQHELRKRPMNTRLVYYVGNFQDTAPFYEAGLDYLSDKELGDFLSNKPKKVVGRPAITNQEAGLTDE